MPRMVKFPDGTRLGSDKITYWSNISGVVNVGLNGSGSSGSYTYGAFTYTPPNTAVADRIVSLLDTWYYAPSDSMLDMTSAIGVAIFTLTPGTCAAATPTTVAITGQQFVTGCTVTMAGITYPATFTDSGDITFHYTGGSVAGTYDVTVTNPAGGGSFTFPQSFILT